MLIKGHGVDIIDLNRIIKLIAKDDEFILGWFTAAEIDDLNKNNSSAEVIGGKIAAKEATVKALETGFSGEVSWQDIELKTLIGESVKIVLSGEALNIARSRKITDFLVSISCTRSMAVASVIAVGDE